MSKKKKNNKKNQDFISEKADKILDIFKATTKKDVDMTKLDRKPDNKKNKIIAGIVIGLFVLALASVAGFLVFNRDSDSKQETKAKLTINAVEAMASGDQLTLEIIYENKEPATIATGTITIHYPSGFYFKKAEPSPITSDNTWQIKGVPAGAAGKIVITGQLVGELNESKEFTGFLTYQPINFNSDFQDTTQKIIKINDTIISLETSLPQIAFSGQEIEYQVKFKNTSSLSLANAKVVLTYPSGFTLTKAEPTADLNNNIWKYEEFKSQDEKTIKIKGIISGNSQENKEFKFQLGLTEPNGVFNVQVEKNNIILIVNPNINLTISGPSYVKPGDEIEYKINVENTSDTNIENLELKLDFSQGMLEKNSIALDKIDNLKSGEKKDLSYKTKILSKIDASVTSLKATLTVNSAKVEGQKFEFSQKAEAQSKIKGDMKFSSEARYYDDDLTKLGSGPLPPQVGKTSSFVVWWNIAAVGAGLKNIEVATTVSEIADKVETADNSLIYDKTNKQIKWTIADLAEGTSEKVAFTIYITPTKDQLNKLLVLTKETVINGIDNNTNENISQSIERLTSDLPNDPVASGQGVVIENK